MGLAAGFVVGLTSMGGATLMTPFLIFVVGLRPHLAIGTDLVYASLIKVVGALIHWKQGSVDMRMVRLLALGSLPTGIAGSLAACAVGRLPAVGDRYLRTAIGLALLAVIVALTFAGRWNARALARWPAKRHRDLATTGWGAVIGAIVGFTSVGSGTLVLPFLLWAYNAPAARLVGTDMVHAAVLLTATGGLFVALGGVQWDVLPWLLAGSLPGVAVGARLSPYLPETVLRLTLMAVLLASAWKLVW
jgi:uncharacterized membrane protein YfcA